MRTLDDYLDLIGHASSELHLVVGNAPAIRSDGILSPIDGVEELTSEDFADLIVDAGIEPGADVAYYTGKARFRVTVFDIGEGLIARLIPAQMPSLASLLS